MAVKRVFAGYYKRYDGKRIYVVRVVKDIDTGEAVVICKDASFSKEDNEHYYLIRYTSFCEQVEVDGVLRDKYVRQTRREIDEGTVREVYEDGFPEPKSKPFTYVDDEYAERAIRCSRTYYEYAKDICENYRMDLRRYKLIRERKQYIGISNREAYQAMCEDLAFAQQSLKTVLNDYADLFRKRFSEGLSIRKAADAMQQNRGVIERRQAALYRAFAQLLQQRDEADGVCRLMRKTEYDQGDIEDLLEQLMQHQSACRSGKRFFFCPCYDKTVTLRIILSVGKQKGQFEAMHRDCFAVSETFSRNLGQNRSLILLAK